MDTQTEDIAGMDRTRSAKQETATMAREATMEKAMAVKNFQGETKLLIGCSHQELPLYHKIF